MVSAGATYDFEPRLIVPDETKSLMDGAIAPWTRGDRKMVRDAVLALSRTYGIDPELPFQKLPRKPAMPSRWPMRMR